MKRLFAICTAALLLFGVGCSSDSDSLGASGEGGLSLELDLSAVTRALNDTESSEALKTSVLKIYDSAGNLLRRYAPATDMPDEIYLIAGNYKATLLVGEYISPTHNKGERTYFGESDFEIKPNDVTECEITAEMLNCVVTVLFDDTITQAINPGYSLTITAAEDENLVYTSSASGYFIPSPEVDTYTWSFVGVKSLDGSDVIKSGTFAAPASRGEHKLTFSYTYRLNVSSATILVDDSTEDFDDGLSFTTQPSIMASGFDIADVQIDNGESSFDFDISGLQSIERVSVTAGDTEVTLFDGGEVVANDCGLYNAQDAMNGSLTLYPTLFDSYSQSGVQEVKITASDIMGTTGSATMLVRTSGIASLGSYDFWSKSAVVRAEYYESVEGEVVIEYRETGAEEWITLETTLDSENNYSAVIAPTWSVESNPFNSSLSVSRFVGGVTHNRSYDMRLRIGEEVLTYYTAVSDDVDQEIPYGDMESTAELSCFTMSNASSTSWASGNNSYSPSLCVSGDYTGMGGEHCAALAGAEAGTLGIYLLAAGNVFLGTFAKSGTNGDANFGQPYEWKSRPKSFCLKYSAQLGEVDYSKHATKIAQGKTDQARIYFAIVNWNTRNKVTSGMSAPSGMWDPATQTSVSGVGDIIAFASLTITESTPAAMQELELPIYYYDTETNPSSAKYSIVIMCTTSNYGDYINGSTNSKMWVDDFKFGY